jgi:hypothetical protein
MEMIFPVIGALVLLLFLGRELVCWYWKINQVVDELKLQNASLTEIRDELVAFRRERAANRKAAKN